MSHESHIKSGKGKTYSVTEINNYIRETVSKEFSGKTVSVVGEISGVSHSGGRHTYLTLKDDESAIQINFWNASLRNKHGESVRIKGEVNYFIKYGKLSINGKSIKNIGEGEQNAQYEKLREKYFKKGYFDRKQPLPNKIQNIGVVTSITGAVLHDLLRILKENGFSGNIYIHDCSVQGVKCAVDVARGIEFFDRSFDVKEKQVMKISSILSNINSDSDSDNTSSDHGDDNVNPLQGVGENIEVDVVLIMRGGGSYEDLKGFSDPKVVEAIYSSNRYTMSAVGHENDRMLSDFVANYRAPTPSAAASAIVAVNNNKNKKLDDFERDALAMKHSLLRDLHKQLRYINEMRSRIHDPREEINKRLNDIKNRTLSYVKSVLYSGLHHVNRIINQLETKNVSNVLNNGFVLLTDKDGNILTTIDKIIDSPITMICSSGKFEVIIKSS
jgi:exodeoxyribonuclease VII large subunit